MSVNEIRPVDTSVISMMPLDVFPDLGVRSGRPRSASRQASSPRRSHQGCGRGPDGRRRGETELRDRPYR
jgi:hypothetical protein